VTSQAQASTSTQIRVSPLLSEDLISLFCGRVLPASFFLLVALAKMESLRSFLAQTTAAGTWLDAVGFYASCLNRLTGAIFMALVVAFFIIRLKPRRSSHNVIHIGVALLGSFMMTAVAIAPMSETPNALTVIATVIMVSGTLITAAALLFLRRSFSITPEARQLVTSGMYSLVRHPMYLGEILGSLGMVLAAVSPFTVAIFTVFVLLQVRRMDYEERILEQAFPDYRLYKQQTPRLIPGVY
jgi:protein-S-isoprenylcysteine O-methyltransferase Ste14